MEMQIIFLIIAGFLFFFQKTCNANFTDAALLSTTHTIIQSNSTSITNGSNVMAIVDAIISCAASPNACGKNSLCIPGNNSRACLCLCGFVGNPYHTEGCEFLNPENVTRFQFGFVLPKNLPPLDYLLNYIAFTLIEKIEKDVSKIIIPYSYALLENGYEGLLQALPRIYVNNFNNIID